MKTGLLQVGARAALAVSMLLAPLSAAEESPQQRIDRLLADSSEALGRGELERSESDAREALGIALDQLGAVYSGLKQFELAEEAYIQASHASVQGANSLLGLAILYLRSGQYDKGIETAEKILAISPLHPGTRHILGKIHFMRGDFKNAVAELTDSRRAEHTDASVSYTLALAHLQSGDPEATTRIFDEMVQTLGESASLRVLFGRAYRGAGLLEAAEREFRRAIELDPNAPRAHYYLGLTILRARDRAGFEEAKREFRAELALNPESYFAHFFLGLVLIHDGELEPSVTHLEKAVSLQPANPDPYLQLGTALSRLERRDEAIAALRKAVELTSDPSRNTYQISNGHFILGRLLRQRGEMAEAEENLRIAGRLKAERARDDPSVLENVIGPLAAAESVDKPETAAILDEEELDEQAKTVLANTAQTYRLAAALACQSLARLAISQSRFDKAAGYLEQGVAWDASLPDSQFNLGVALFKAGRLERAVQPLIADLKSRPDRVQSQQLLAHLALQLTERRAREPAEMAVDFLLADNPGVPQLRLLKGHLAAQRSQFEEALLQYRAALEVNPSTPEAHYYAGTVLIRLGRLPDAKKEFEAELRLQPQHAKALYHKAFVLLSEDANAEAIEILERVIRLRPDYADAYYQLGKAQLETGSTLLAVANLETAAHQSPDSPHIHYQLFRAYQASGRKEDAEQALARYRELKRALEEANLTRQRESAEQPPD